MILGAINLKTIYINFKFLSFKKAIKFPILISRKVWLKSCSGKIEIIGDIRSGLIKIGFGEVGIFDKRHSRSILGLYGKIVFNGAANIGHGSKIIVAKDGILSLGNKFTISAESQIICYKKITFGENCLISWDNLFMDTDFHKMMDEKDKIINEPKEITVGNHVWIGCRCLVLKGSVIKDGNIIGANSIVVNELENKNSVYVGNPVKCVKKNISWI
ncbi:MAG: acyltransferase [Prevotellaceae bacterium]|jgi:acetyltransferase-like isoleucine patch superfamily enzyme|nr:acyltransferase [Prevotellaceae bacterium]